MFKTRPNILFVSPQSLDSNTGYHVQWYAAALQRAGARCAVAVPVSSQGAASEKCIGVSSGSAIDVMSYDEALTKDPRSLFRNGHTVDVLYAWTPRECVRRFAQKMLGKSGCKLIVHLEDNEEHLIEVATGKSFDELASMSQTALDSLIPIDRFHPLRGRQFLASADGISCLIETLYRFNVAGVSQVTLLAPVDESLFFERPVNFELRRQLGIQDEECVITYAGNVHDANLAEVHELYRAVERLNTKGISTTLLRTGTDAPLLVDQFKRFTKVTNLGWIERGQIPLIQACANLFVQPGQADAFNNERVPSKLPEFFATGRPVILPLTNIGLKVQQGEHAFVVERACAQSIADAVAKIQANPNLIQTLSKGARRFFVLALKADVSPMTGLINDVMKLRLRPETLATAI